jgi:hypothetical protein
MRRTTPVMVRLDLVLEKSHTKRREDKKKTIYQKYIVCSNEAIKDIDRQNKSLQKDITRTHCDGRVQFNVNKEGI